MPGYIVRFHITIKGLVTESANTPEAAISAVEHWLTNNSEIWTQFGGIVDVHDAEEVTYGNTK